MALLTKTIYVILVLVVDTKYAILCNHIISGITLLISSFCHVGFHCREIDEHVYLASIMEGDGDTSRNYRDDHGLPEVITGLFASCMAFLATSCQFLADNVNRASTYVYPHIRSCGDSISKRMSDLREKIGIQEFPAPIRLQSIPRMKSILTKTLSVLLISFWILFLFVGNFSSQTGKKIRIARRIVEHDSNFDISDTDLARLEALNIDVGDKHYQKAKPLNLKGKKTRKRKPKSPSKEVPHDVDFEDSQKIVRDDIFINGDMVKLRELIIGIVNSQTIKQESEMNQLEYKNEPQQVGLPGEDSLDLKKMIRDGGKEIHHKQNPISNDNQNLTIGQTDDTTYHSDKLKVHHRKHEHKPRHQYIEDRAVRKLDMGKWNDATQRKNTYQDVLYSDENHSRYGWRRAKNKLFKGSELNTEKQPARASYRHNVVPYSYLILDKLDPVYHFRRRYMEGNTADVENRDHILPYLLGNYVNFEKFPRRILLDLGASFYNSSIEWFLKNYPATFDEIHAFEAEYQKLVIPPNAPRLKPTIYAYNKFVSFFENVVTVNVTEFIVDYLAIQEEDMLVVKMDIEGDEYAVLKDWEKRGIFPLIDELFVEVHYKHPDMEPFGWDMFAPHTRQEALKLFTHLRNDLGVFVHPWP